MSRTSPAVPATDTITGSAGDNVLAGGAGNDTIAGGLGNDVIRGGAGNDILHGDAGNDTFDEEAAASGNDTIVGGAGVDHGRLLGAHGGPRRSSWTESTPSGDTGSPTSEADTISTDTENLTGGAGDDALTGNAARQPDPGWRGRRHHRSASRVTTRSTAARAPTSSIAAPAMQIYCSTRTVASAAQLRAVT